MLRPYKTVQTAMRMLVNGVSKRLNIQLPVIAGRTVSITKASIHSGRSMSGERSDVLSPGVCRFPTKIGTFIFSLL